MVHRVMRSENESTLFASTAEYYASYRPRYSERMFTYLGNRFSLDNALVLDIGCGTGEIAIPMSRYAEEVIAMDPSGEMLEEGKTKASEAKRTNIEWRIGSDADLGGISESFQLATMGRSFHWMNQERTLENLLQLVNPDGGIALFGESRCSEIQSG